MASLVPDYAGTSDEGSESSMSSPSSEEEEEEEEEESDADFRGSRSESKLPKPDFDNATAKNSVFVNPFAEEENAKKAILEKHVKMVPTRDKLQTINGRKICWNHRKGRCRFGHRCAFAHDTDLQENAEEPDKVTSGEDAPNDRTATASGLRTNRSDGAPRNKRPGLGDGLVPGKKVIRMYKRQKANE